MVFTRTPSKSKIYAWLMACSRASGPELAAFVEHGQVVVERNVVCHSVARAQAEPAARQTRLQRAAHPLAHFGLAGPANEIHVNPAKNRQAMSIAPLGVDDVFNGVLKGVLGVDTHVFDQVLQDGAQV